MTTFNIGIDVGYGYTKFVAPGGSGVFPTLAGSVNRSVFSFGGDENEIVVSVDGREFMVGDAAINLSRHIDRWEHQAWFSTPQYKAYVAAALVLARARGNVQIVTGLPLS